MMTTKRTGYPIIDDILETVAPSSTEQPRPEQAGRLAALNTWCVCGHAKYNHGEDDFSLQDCRVGGCGCDNFKQHDDAPAAPERGEWRKVYDGPSRPMIETSDGRLLSISQFESGRWNTYEQEDSDIDAIVIEHNQHSALIEQQRFLEDRIAAQTETMAKVVHERNELREQHSTLVAQREQLIESLKQIHVALPSGIALTPAERKIATIVADVLTAIEQEGTRER